LLFTSYGSNIFPRYMNLISSCPPLRRHHATNSSITWLHRCLLNVLSS